MEKKKTGYKSRMANEYYFIRKKTGNLRRFIAKVEMPDSKVKLKYPKQWLHDQLKIMEEYMGVMKMRCDAEGVILNPEKEYEERRNG